MRSHISGVLAFSCLFVGHVALAQAQEMPETFLAAGHQLEEPAAPSPDPFTQNTGGIFINRVPNCTVLGLPVDPCD